MSKANYRVSLSGATIAYCTTEAEAQAIAKKYEKKGYPQIFPLPDTDTIPKREIWLRLGIMVELSEENIEAILNGDKESLRIAIADGRFCVDGNTYIPAEAIEEYNNEYSTNHPTKDLEFEF